MDGLAVDVLVVDDHAVVRAGCRRLLEPPLGRFRVVEAADGPSALALVERDPPALVILDLNLPGSPTGLDLLRQLVASGPPVLVFSMHEAPSVVARCLEAGARGYLCKSDDPAVMAGAAETVLEGRLWLDHRMACAVAALGPGRPQRDVDAPLPEREGEIMRLLAETAELDSVARRLGISYKTLANTLVRLRNRYGVRRTADLVRIAVRQLDETLPG